MPTTAGLVLAAGAGSRFGQPKAPVVVNEERLVDRSVRVLTEAGCDPIVVVLGAWVGAVPGAEAIINEEWAEGMGSSLRAGLSHLLDSTDAHAVVVTLVDLPGLTSEAVQRIVGAPLAHPIVQGGYEGRPGHPVRISRELWDEAIDVAHGDEGARRLIRGRPDVLLIEVGDVADGHDLDVPVARD